MSATSPDLPIGESIDPAPARRPSGVTLPGRCATLEPLDAARHGGSLYDAVRGHDAAWLYLFEPPPQSREEFDQRIRAKAESSDRVYFAIVDERAGTASGYASYLRIEPAHRCIEVGDILFTPAIQRTRAATDAMFLMARHAFEDLGYRRYEWKCDALNAPSMRAAVRLGFTFEGIFRQHMIVKGRNRDTAWFAMLDDEWPARKAAFERWLDPSNFGPDGRQRVALGALNGADATRVPDGTAGPPRARA